MTKTTVPWQSIIEEAEMDALAWKTMSKVKDGDTLPTSGAYRRMMTMLQGRAQELETEGGNIKAVHDWLALALFAKDRARFIRICAEADRADDPVYRRAEHWLKTFIDTEQKAGDGGS